MKSCIVYTVKDDPHHLRCLSKSLKLVSDNLIQVKGLFDTDFIFFNDPPVVFKGVIMNLLEDKLDELKKAYGIKNNFIYKVFDTRQPDYSPEIKAKITTQIGYKNMCRFWAGEIFKDKDILNYDYYLRLDCDSYITDRVPYDPFKLIDSEDKFYGHLKGAIFQDSPHVIVDFRKTLMEFEWGYNGKIIKSCMDFPEGSLYFTNFEIVKPLSFRDSGYMDLYKYLDNTGGIYMHRWGDAPIRYAGINMLMGNSGVMEILDIKYTHQHFVNGVLV